MLSARPAPKQRRRLGAMVIEVVFIVLGVLIALGVNEWRGARQEAALVETALDNLAEEMARNHENVSWRLAYHTQLRDSLVQHIRPAVTPPYPAFERISLPEMGFGDGFGFRMLDRIAWETARSTGAVGLMSYEDVLVLSRTYETQAYLSAVEQRIGNTMHVAMEYLLSDDPDRRFLSLLLLEALFYEIPFVEHQLKRAYETGYQRLRPGQTLAVPDTTTAAPDSSAAR